MRDSEIWLSSTHWHLKGFHYRSFFCFLRSHQVYLFFSLSLSLSPSFCRMHKVIRKANRSNKNFFKSTLRCILMESHVGEKQTTRETALLPPIRIEDSKSIPSAGFKLSNLKKTNQKLLKAFWRKHLCSKRFKLIKRMKFYSFLFISSIKTKVRIATMDRRKNYAYSGVVLDDGNYGTVKKIFTSVAKIDGEILTKTLLLVEVFHTTRTGNENIFRIDHSLSTKKIIAPQDVKHGNAVELENHIYHYSIG